MENMEKTKSKSKYDIKREIEHILYKDWIVPSNPINSSTPNNEHNWDDLWIQQQMHFQ